MLARMSSGSFGGMALSGEHKGGGTVPYRRSAAPGEGSTPSRCPPRPVAYAAMTRAAQGKDQDRFYIVHHRSGRAELAFGICDGHSVHSVNSGIVHAEAAARWLATRLHKGVKHSLGEAEESGEPTEPLSGAASEVYLAHQRRCEKRYSRDVETSVLAAKAKLEADLGEELPLELPQEGGTTATALLLHAGGLLVTWVGDSRAVMGESRGDGGDGGEGGGAVATRLTSDHNTGDESERDRLELAGGKASSSGEMSGHVYVESSEGSIKVTRSLGDTPFHRNDAVTARPGVRHVRVAPSCTCVVVASDGVWDHLSDDEVVRIVDAERAAAGATPDAAAAACAAVLDAIDKGQADGSLGPHVDDKSVAVVLLGPPSQG